MPVDTAAITQAAEDAAKKLGISAEEDSVEEDAKETPAADEEKGEDSTPESEEEVEEGEEAEEEEGEPEPEARGSRSKKTVPLERFNKVYGKMKQLERAVEYMNQRLQMEPPPQHQQAAPLQEEKLPDFEQMSNKDLALWVIDALGKRVDTTIEKRINPVISESKQEKANRDVSDCAKRHKDYLDYADDMVQIANKYPMLGAEEVYRIAKGGTDGEKVVRDMARKTKEKIALKKKAVTEKRSSPSEKTGEKTEFKSVREAGLAAAAKLGLK